MPENSTSENAAVVGAGRDPVAGRGAVDWRAVLADLRASLPADRSSGRAAAGPVRGSLRWLEAEMARRGGNAAALRNIVYRDVGTASDKAVLAGILTDLAREVGRPLNLGAAAPHMVPLPAELELLGRSKKRVYKQFLAGVRAGRSPRLIVTGRRGAGKTVLLEHVARALDLGGYPLLRLKLEGDVLVAGQQAGVAPQLPGPGRSFAALAARQAQWSRSIWQRLAERSGDVKAGVLLVRVTADLHFGDDVLRAADGSPISPAAWAAEQLLRQAPPGVAVLLALEDASGLPPGVAETVDLRPPTLAEARTYLMTRLNIGREQADALVRETGRNLDRLSLLASVGRGEVGQGEGGAAELLQDPDLSALAAALAALALPLPPSAGRPVQDEVLAAALGHAPQELPAHARALLMGSAQAGWWPAGPLAQALGGVPLLAREAAARRILEPLVSEPLAPADPASSPIPALSAAMSEAVMSALVLLRDWNTLAAQVAAHPDEARHLPALWSLIRGGAGGSTLEALARALAVHHAGRGEYGDPQARDALLTLMESPRDPVRAWARVKLAESSVDSGNFEAARAQLAHPDLRGLLDTDALAVPAESRPWWSAAQADVLLVQAALARWSGDLDAATRAVADPRTAQGGPRAALWRGLIAKDAGRWSEAASALQSVPPSSPLLSARARYQEGDLRLRLGQPASALVALEDAARRLPLAGGSAEEAARVLARAATALRRLGRPAEGLETLRRALATLDAGGAAGRGAAQLPPDWSAVMQPRSQSGREDRLSRARLVSESLPILLALGRADEAMAQAHAALRLLAQPSVRPAEAAYRLRRTRYRLALAYLTRGVGLPYLYPFAGPQRDHPDLRHARALLDSLLQPGLDAALLDSDREQVLTFDLLLTRALADPAPQAALAFAERALAMTDHPYAAAQAHAIRAEARLRAGQTEAALSDINRAHALLRRVALGTPLPGNAMMPGSGELPGRSPVPSVSTGATVPTGSTDADPGLTAQLLALEARATIHEGLPALLWLRDALQDVPLYPFRAGVWREAGRALEGQHPDPVGVLRALYSQGRPDGISGVWPLADVRLRDVLWLSEVAADGSRFSDSFT